MQIPLQSALDALSRSRDQFVSLFHHGSLSVEIYKPNKADRQQPHEQDKVYEIISGEGEFMNGDT